LHLKKQQLFNPSLPNGRFFHLCSLTVYTLGEAFLTAYTEYLERVFLASDELVTVDETTVPEEANYPLLEEWADVA
jgi:hypothetical protein